MRKRTIEDETNNLINKLGKKINYLKEVNQERIEQRAGKCTKKSKKNCKKNHKYIHNMMPISFCPRIWKIKPIYKTDCSFL
jgi:hypothetical protein